MNQKNSTPRFVSAHSRTQWLAFALGLNLLMSLMAVASGLLENNLLYSVAAGNEVTMEAATANDTRQQIVAILQLVVFIFSSILFLIWIYRAHKNLPALGAAGLRYSPGFAVGAWFIPLVNLILPYHVMKEIWRASDPDMIDPNPTVWQKAHVSPLLAAWWIFWFLDAAGGRLAGQLASGVDTLDGFIAVGWLTVLSDSLTVVNAALAIWVVTRIDERQEDRSRRVALPGVQQVLAPNA